MTSYARTVLGDIAAEDLGLTYAHEHLIIDHSRATDLYPAFLLPDVDRAIAEVNLAKAEGLGTVIDAMPCDAGRNIDKLVRVAKATGVHLIATTGLHDDRYYPSWHWSHTATVEELAELLEADVVIGIDRRDYGGPIVERTEHRAGLVKVASGPRLSPLQTRSFAAAAEVHTRTGCPILTHCEDGTGAIEQVETLTSLGVPSHRIVLSHTDRCPDDGYHREILATGVNVEYDRAFRWPSEAPNETLGLVERMAAEGFLDQIMLGTDSARGRYWTSYGGTPGLAYLLTDFRRALLDRGLATSNIDRIFRANPARFFSQPTWPEPS